MNSLTTKSLLRKTVINKFNNGNFTRNIYNSITNYSKPVVCDEKKRIMVPDCKVAFIMGGSEGIGFACANHFLKAGLRAVCITGVDSTRGQDAVNCLNRAYGKNKAMFINSSCNCMMQLEESFKVAKEAFSNIDIVVNSVGICDGQNWEKEVVTNLIGLIRGTLLGYQYVGREGYGKGGVIINISGTTGMEPLPAAPTLCSTHHGVLGLTRSFGDELHFKNSGVRVVALCPGVTNTAFYKGKQSMTPKLSDELQNYVKAAKRQAPEACGLSAIHLIKFAQNGSVWVCDSSRLFVIEIPHWEKNSTLEAQFI